MTNLQCIHIPDGSVVISGEVFDQACAAIAERDRLIAEMVRLDTDACGERAERESWKHAFKNFHRQLCERFGYVHDEKDWLRDQVSLIEHIAKRAAHEPSASNVTLTGKQRWRHLIHCNAGTQTPLGGDMCICLRELSMLAETLSAARYIAGDERATLKSGVVNCREAGQGRGLCIECASGNYDKCLYVASGAIL